MWRHCVSDDIVQNGSDRIGSSHAMAHGDPTLFPIPRTRETGTTGRGCVAHCSTVATWSGAPRSRAATTCMVVLDIKRDGPGLNYPCDCSGSVGLQASCSIYSTVLAHILLMILAKAILDINFCVGLYRRFLLKYSTNPLLWFSLLLHLESLQKNRLVCS